jgi:hypothetical protein
MSFYGRLLFKAKRNSVPFPCQGFCGKYKPSLRGLEIFRKTAKRPDLAGKKGYGIIFAAG